MAVVYERVALEEFAEDFAKYSQMKAELREKLEREFEEKFATQSEKFDKLIELTSKVVEVEVADEETESTDVVPELGMVWRAHTFAEPNTYMVYYQSASSGSNTELAVPEEYTYTISGDNREGFVVTVKVEK